MVKFNESDTQFARQLCASLVLFSNNKSKDLSPPCQPDCGIRADPVHVFGPQLANG